MYFYSQLTLFRKYQQWKCLHFWYKFISWNKYYHTRRELQVPLTVFLLCTPLRDTSLQISEVVNDIMEICLYDGSVAEENTLQQFKEQQVGKREALWRNRGEDYCNGILTFESTLVLFCGANRIIKLKMNCFLLNLNHLSYVEMPNLQCNTNMTYNKNVIDKLVLKLRKTYY